MLQPRARIAFNTRGALAARHSIAEQPGNRRKERAFLDIISERAKGYRVYTLLCFTLCHAIGHDTWEFRHLGNPAAIRLPIELDRERGEPRWLFNDLFHTFIIPQAHAAGGAGRVLSWSRMVEIHGDKVKRDGQVVGYVEGVYVRDHNYKKIGFVDAAYIRDMLGKKLAYIEGEYLYSYDNRKTRTDLDAINKAVTGDALPELMRCAVYQLIGA